ncbi:thermonuclease family protein [Candidatus Saccharibacteria bacterium]|nr:thermonuclease family protein [Candidatus Saccharibacteria bacterium]
MTTRQKRKLAGLLTALIIAGFTMLGNYFGWLNEPVALLGQHDPGTYKVVRFSDGDTITVDMNGKHETVRMIGVDTPETHHPDRPVQCYGPAASAYTKNLIGNQKVRLEADPTNQNRDRYGRLLRYVYLPDGRLVQAEIIKSGHGFAYTSFPFTKKEEFVKLEEQAKSENKGLWGNCTVTEENGYKSTNPAE